MAGSDVAELEPDGTPEPPASNGTTTTVPDGEGEPTPAELLDQASELLRRAAEMLDREAAEGSGGGRATTSTTTTTAPGG